VDLALVVPTLGRVERLRRLLDSMAGRLRAGDELIIVAQRDRDEVERLVADFDAGDARVVVTTSDPGAARGRNRGVESIDGADPLLVFPNDTTWFPPDVIERLRGLPVAFEAGAMTVVDEHGPKFVLPAAGAPLDRWTVWSVIEMGILVRRRVFDEVGGFDPELGTGAPSPWQAGEATDFLLRLATRRPDLASGFDWLPPDVVVGGIADAHGLERSARRHKLRAYGRGLGHVVTRWRYPLPWRLAFVGGGLAFGIRHRTDYTPADGWWVFLGRLEGALGRPLGRPVQATAVQR
jgi:glycosyltransferase involved in cell wall biosynthesis